MHMQRRATLPPLTGFAPGQECRTQILSNRRTGWFQITATATLTLASGGATTILNDGSLAALFQYIVFRENGDPIVYTDGRALSRDTELGGNGIMANIRLTAIAAGAYTLRETIIIPFCDPTAVAPWETPFTEINPSAPSYVGVSFTTHSLTDMIGLLVTSSNAATLSALSINVQQIYDNEDIRQMAPLFRPRWRDLFYNITANGQLDAPMNAVFSSALRRMMVQQDSNLGEIGDACTAFQVRTDSQIIVGEQGDVPFPDTVQAMGYLYPGALSLARTAAGQPINPAYLKFNWQDSGRISNVLVNSQIGPNFRFLFTGNQSSVSGVTATYLRIVLNELFRIQGVTASKLPFLV